MKVVAALSVTVLVLGCRAQRKEIPMVASPFEDALVHELIVPPKESLAVLNSIDEGAPPPPFGPGEASASELLRGRCATMLRAPYRAGPHVPFVAFRSEAGRFDVVRARYATPANVPSLPATRVEIASTLAVMSIIATPTPDEAAMACIDRIAHVADRILSPSTPLALVEKGASGNIVYGTPRGPRTAENPDWEQDLRWWCSPDRLGFVVLAGDGSPTRVVLGWDADSNAIWFRLYARK